MDFMPRIPIWQAPTGSVACPELCAAVARAGGMGAMGVTWTSEIEARRNVGAVLGSGAFQVNFVLHFEPAALDAVLDEGAPVVTFSWGVPDRLIDRVHQAGAACGVQVGNAEGAKRAVGIGADFLVCQGVEAGGHVQSTTPLMELLPQVLQTVGDVPVIAAGGLAESADVARVLASGAKGAMFGTRFVATQESRAHDDYKRALIEGGETALTICFNGGWPDAPHRVLRNSTLDAWEAAGCPPHERHGER